MTISCNLADLQSGEAEPSIFNSLHRTTCPRWNKKTNETTLPECRAYAEKIIADDHKISDLGPRTKKEPYVLYFVSIGLADEDILTVGEKKNLHKKLSKTATKMGKKGTCRKHGNPVSVARSSVTKVYQNNFSRESLDIPTKNSSGKYALNTATSKFMLMRLCAINKLSPINEADRSLRACWWNTLAIAGLISGVTVIKRPPYSKTYLESLPWRVFKRLVRKHGVRVREYTRENLTDGFRLAGLTTDQWELVVNDHCPIKTARFLKTVCMTMQIFISRKADRNDPEVWIKALAKAKHPIVLKFVQDRKNASFA